MTAKAFLFDIEARNSMMQGVDTLARAVGVTLGPRGRNVVLENGAGKPHITKDGDSVARNFELENHFENMGVQILKEVAARTNEEAGDGTSTATLLAQALMHDGVKLVAGGANPMEVKRGIDRACTATVAALQDAARPVEGRGDIEHVGTVSANGEAEIGALIADAMERVGKDGVILVEENTGFGTEIDIVEGLQFDNGYLSAHFITDPETSGIAFENALILLYDGKISTLPPLIPILEAVSQAAHPLLIIADDVDGEALSTLVVNKLRGGLRVAAVKAPAFGDRRKAMLEDIAAITGGEVISPERGMKLEETGIDTLGRARRIAITRKSTTLVGGSGTPDAIAARVKQVRLELDEASTGVASDALRERLAKMAGGVAILRVGGGSEAEVRERKDRVEDALNATRAAVQEGVTVGGGAALLRASRILADLSGDTPDQDAGIALVRRALTAPLIRIADNAGHDGTYVIEKVRESDMVGFGFDAASGDYGDLRARGIIDPVKVVRIALENACAVAGAMITTQVAIADVQAEDELAQSA